MLNSYNIISCFDSLFLFDQSENLHRLIHSIVFTCTHLIGQYHMLSLSRLLVLEQLSIPSDDSMSR